MIPGVYEMEIKRNSIGQTGSGTEYIQLICETNSEQVPVKIFLTARATGRARAALRACDFDVTKEPLSILRDNPTFLAGRWITVIVEDTQWGLQGSFLPPQLDDQRLGEIETRLRAATSETAQQSESEEGAAPSGEDIPF